MLVINIIIVDMLVHSIVASVVAWIEAYRCVIAWIITYKSGVIRIRFTGKVSIHRDECILMFSSYHYLACIEVPLLQPTNHLLLCKGTKHIM